ncbi:FAD-binding oxidoreductase [Aspergillus saccharolyticus JOP 1030-1]|uniref:Putative oxidoreductase n=1 Tax=Aspergillus saccharolyticus JOP 1030-1 TaxID=1450539 RepID=A0A319ASV9_9EURO|nr:putative oxidoreductase [Aspergillus saccharolyticus JOP 1030-1]PYH49332.1 putative oxidoreductase [Aspergillus saccharolyticus JOP 1030-1]
MGLTNLTSACCWGLYRLLGANLTSFDGSAAYNASLASYFSQQESQLYPSCIVAPTTVEQVSTAVRYLTTNSTCDFAVRSGGHQVFAGAANIANGVTIDLRGLDQIEVSDDYSTATVGVGATWGDVYAALDPLNLTAAGGRVSGVGVGGLTIGGGISYHSPRYGWTCDTVVDFEVVLANGTIVHANERENPELQTALRGGSNNFGVVTRIQLATIEQDQIWAGLAYYSFDTIDAQLQAAADFSQPDGYDEYASLVLSFGFLSTREAALVNSLVYTKPEPNPPAFQAFTAIPSVSSTLRLTNMSAMSIEQGSFQPNGDRQLWLVTAFESSVSMLNATYRHWNRTLADVSDVAGIGWSLSLEPLPPAIYSRHSDTNSLGLSDTSGSLMIVLLSASWTHEADDATVTEAGRSLISGVEDDAHAQNAYHPFKYLNYAAPWQSPIASYGDASVERLRRVSQAVDPERVFQQQVPGGFKLP